MSIAILEQVYEETRRLAIGGSALAKDDFRLKKLVAPLEQSAQKAPVFGQVAKAIDKVVSSVEKEVSTALLDLASLVLAILYTQGKTACEGSIAEIKTLDGIASAQQSSARSIQPVIKALSTKGSDRLSVIHQAYKDRMFQDVRLVPYALDGLEDGSIDIANLLANEVLPAYGKAIYPLVMSKLDIKGKTGDARRLKLLHAIDPQAARPLVLDSLENGSKVVRAAATECLGSLPEDLPFLLVQAKSKAEDVRIRALSKLGSYDDEAVVDILIKAAKGADYIEAKDPIRLNRSQRLIAELCGYLRELFGGAFASDDKQKALSFSRLCPLMDALQGRDESVVIDLLHTMYDARKQLEEVRQVSWAFDTLQKLLFLMLESRNKALRQRLVDDRQTFDLKLFESSFAAGIFNLSPKDFYDAYAPLFIDPGDLSVGRKNRRILIEGLLSEPHLPGSARPRYTHKAGEVIEDVAYAIAHATWDKRWLDAAIKVGSFRAAIAFGDANDTKLKKYLMELLDGLPQTIEKDYDRLHILLSVIDFGYPEATDLVMKHFKMFNNADRVKHLRHDYFLQVARQIPKLPQSSVPALEGLLPELNREFVELIWPHLEKLKSTI